MEKYEGSIVNVNGGMRLPIGFRFHPTDEELIVHYLRRKIFGVPLPASIIPELDVFQHDPWTLPGDLKEKRYFFGRKLGNEKGCKIAGGSGYWKAIGKSRPILTCVGNHIVGAKKTFIFCHSKFQWILQEYQFVGSATLPHNIKASRSKLGEWVIYTLFQRRRRPNKKQRIHSKSEMIHSNSCT